MRKFIKAIYLFIPFKGSLLKILRMFWSPPESVFKHLYFKGVCWVQVDSGNKFKMRLYGDQLENEIFWRGLTNGWEKESMKIWMKLVRHSKVIVDIGANTGIYSLVARTLNKDANIYAFEPIKRVFNKLQNNILLNKFDIVAYEAAISNIDGEAIIYDVPMEHVYSVSLNQNFHDPSLGVVETRVKTVTLDTFIENEDLSNIDLLKIDVETFEPQVLEGFSKYLMKFQPTMLIEILNDDIGKKVHQLVADINYEYYNIDERGGVRRVNTVLKSDYYNYLFCKPQIAKNLGLE